MRGSRLHQKDFDIEEYEKNYATSNQTQTDKSELFEPEKYIYVPIIGKKINKTQLIVGISIIAIILFFSIYSYIKDSKNATNTHAHIVNSSHKLKRVKFNLP